MRAIGYIVVLRVALLFSSGLSNTMLLPVTPERVIVAENGHFIPPSGQGNYLYMRGAFFIPEDFSRAAVQIVGTSKLILYCNKKVVARLVLPRYRTETVDITWMVKSGKNHLAASISNICLTGDRTARMAIKVWYFDRRGQKHMARFPAGWRAVVNYPAEQRMRVDWLDERYVDETWEQPGWEGSKRIAAVALPHHATLHFPLRGSVIASLYGSLGSGAFTKRFHLGEHPNSGFIRVLPSGPSNLTLNGYTITQIDKNFQEISCYPITPYLRKGFNTIQVRVLDSSKPHTLFLEGLFLNRNGDLTDRIETDASWNYTGMSTGVVKLRDIANTKLPMVAQPLTPTLLTIAKVIKYKVIFRLLILGIVWVDIGWFIKKCRQYNINENSINPLAFYIYLAPLICLGGAYFAARDVRIVDNFAHHPLVLFLAALLLVATRCCVYRDVKQWKQRKGERSF